MLCVRKEKTMTVKDLIKQEVDKLPENALSEVLDFIQFLEQKRQKGDLMLAAQRISERSFEKVWNNEEDAAYDKL
jgi:hypothetical protein